MIVEDLIDLDISEYIGYVYMTTFLDLDKSYIGKKVFLHNTKRKIGKKEKALMEGKGRKPIHEKVQKDSGWKDYYGSEKEVIELAKTTPKDRITRTVLQLCKTKRELSYYEVMFQFKYDVLSSDKFFNSNISGRYFRKDLAS